MQRRRTVLIILAVVLLLALPVLWSLLDVIADWLFFTETGYTAVFTRTLAARAGLGALFGIALPVFLLINAAVARRRKLPPRMLSFGEGIRQFTTHDTERLIRPLMLAAAVLFFLIAVPWGAGQWKEFLLFLQGRPVGTADPVLGRDIGFYLFTLPFVESARG